MKKIVSLRFSSDFSTSRARLSARGMDSKGGLEGTQHIAEGEPHLCDGATSKDLVCPETALESRIPIHLAQSEPQIRQIRQIGAARNTPSIDGSRYPTVHSHCKELDAGPIEFATGLEATRLLNTRGLPRHILEQTTKVLHGFRPSASVDSQSLENRGLVLCGSLILA